LIYTFKDFLESLWWLIFAKASKQSLLFFLYALQWCKLCWAFDLYLEFLGSCSHCRVTNGILPCVLGPTSFYLKIWVNLLTIRMLLCSSDEHQNVVVFFIRISMLIMIFIWVHHWWMYWWVSEFVQCVTYDFLGYIFKK